MATTQESVAYSILPDLSETNVTLGNGTGSPEEDGGGTPVWVGFICAFISVFVFGSNFIPVKKFQTGDGMFFQWVLCCAIFITGEILQIVQRSDFYPEVMIGGAIWCVGNACVVPIIKTIGMGLGLCIWCVFNLLVGWAAGRFGILGTAPKIPNNVGLNYAGVALVTVSLALFVLVKPEVSQPPPKTEIYITDDAEVTAMEPMSEKANGKRPSIDDDAEATKKAQALMFFEKWSPLKQKLLGIFLSMFSGTLYGLQFVPTMYIMYHKKDEGASQNGLDYVFSQYCGIFLTSTVIFLIYCAVSKNVPRVYPRVILAGFASGVMWAIAGACWFVANKVLSETVSFPIIMSGPGLVASLLWGVLVFKEIRGKRNIITLLAAFCFSVTGSILAGVSLG